MSLSRLLQKLQLFADEFVDMARSAARDERASPINDASITLEQRVMLSASPLPTPDVVAVDSATPMSVDSAATVRELVFVQGEDAEIEELFANNTLEERGALIIRLDADRDGIDQISEALAEFQDIDALHLVTHGSAGTVQLGNTLLTTDTLAGYAGSIASWRDALSDHADILFYGCDLAATTAGEALMESIAELCDCDVAASDDITGHEDLGGDWEFEYLVGSIETNVAFSQEVQDNWYFTLDITSNLVAHYEFEEGSGTTAGDSTANNNDGTLTNSPAWTSTSVVGSNALDFTGDSAGSNAVVTVADDPSLNFDGDFTVSLWYNSSVTQSGATRLIGSHDGDQGFSLYASSDGSLNFFVEANDGLTTATISSGFISDGNWHHVVARRSGNTTDLRLDSTAATGSATGTLGQLEIAAPLTIGGESATVSDYEGLLDDVRIYTRQLSVSDVGELYALGSGGGGGGGSYSDPSGSGNTAEWISNVTFAGINNTTGQDTSAYGDYTAQSATVNIGETNTLSVTIDDDGDNDISAWIDWNQDGDFADAGEEYIIATSVSTFGPHTIDITTPNDATIGTTRLRVGMSWQSPPSADGGQPFGEWEDYSVVVASNVSPVPNPADVVVPIAQSVNEDTPLTFSVSGGNAITVDSGSSYDPIVTTTLSVLNGTLTLASTSGITFLNGTSDGDATLTIAGTEAAINTALDGLQYLSNQDYNGSDALTVTTGSDAAAEANLYARYEFLSGATTDESGNGRDGSTSGDPILTTDPERGDVLSFDGDDFVNVTNGTSGLNEEVTVSAWVNLDAGQQDSTFLSIGDEVYVILDPTNPSYGLGGRVGGFTSYSLDSSDRVGGSGWRHVAVTLDDLNNELRVYLDGELTRSSNYSGMEADWPTAVSQDIIIGGLSDGSRAFVGSIDDARVYDRALTQDEIIAIMGDNGFDSETVNITVDPVNDSPTFTATPTENEAVIDSGVTNPSVITSADLDNDGDLDLIGATSDGEILWYANDGDGGFSTGTSVFNTAGYDFTSIATGDIDGDGDLDFVVTNNTPDASEDGILIFENQFVDSGATSFTMTSMESTSFGAHEVAVADLDGDSRLDVVASFSDTGEVVVYEQNTSGLFTRSTVTSIAGARGLDVGHIDGDGHLDIAIAGSGGVIWLENDGGATAGFTAQTALTLSEIADVVIEDVNGDANADIGYLRDFFFGTELGWLENDGTATPGFTQNTIASLGNFSTFGNLVAADLDATGGVDFAISATSTYDIRIFENDGAGNFAEDAQTLSPSGPAWVEGADLDGDGDLDLIIAQTGDSTFGAIFNWGSGLHTTVHGSEDTTITGLQFQIDDVDANGADLSVTVSVGDGSVTIPTGAVTFSSGNSGNSVTFTGAVAEINSALSSFSYTPTADFFGDTTLTVSVNDQGNTGAGGPSVSASLVTLHVQSVNDAPTVSVNSIDVNFTERSPVGIDVNATISDIDDTVLRGATIRISGNYEVGVDQLQFTDQNGITGSYDNSTGVLTLSGSASVADYQTALRSIVFANASDNPSTATRTIEWVVNDGDADSSPVTRNIVMNAVNDAPVVTAPGSAYSFTEQGSLNIHGTGFSVVDADDNGGTMTATFSVGEGRVLIDAGDSGVVLASGNFNSSGNSTDAVTFTGTKSQINALLSGTSTGTIVYYQDLTTSSDVPSTSTTITLTVNDQGNTGADPGNTGDASSEEHAASQVITITSVNDAPSLLGTNLISNGDFASDLTGWTTTGAAEWSFGRTIFGNSNVVGPHTLSQTFATNAGETYLLEFDYRDGHTSLNQQLEVTVDGSANLLTTEQILTDTDGSTFVRYRFSFTADSSSATINFTDRSDDADSMSASTIGVNGVLDNVTVRQAGGQLGTAAFAEDGSAVVLDGDVTLFDAEIEAAMDDFDGTTLTLVRNGGANSDDVFSGSGNLVLNAGTLELSSTNIGTYTNTGGQLSITFNGTPTSAQINEVVRSIAYENTNDVPPANVQIDWTFNDNNDGSQGTGGTLDATGYTIVTLSATNDDPTNAGSLPSDVAVTEDIISTVDLSAIDFSDVDAGSSDLTVTLLTATGGELTLASDVNIDFGGTATARTLTGTLAELNNYFNNSGNINYLHGTPDTFGDNADTITVVINDNGNTGTGGGTDQTLGAVNVDITAVNDEEVLATNTGTTVAEGSSGTVITTAMLETTDVDNTAAQLVYTVNVIPVNGTLRLSGTALTAGQTFTQADINAGNVTYDHDGSQTSSDSFDFTVDDGAGTTTSSSFNVTVTNANDAPVVNVSGVDLNFTEQNPVGIDVSATISDVDDTNLEGAVIQIVGNYEVGFDELSFTNQNGISGVWDSGSGTLTLSGTATVANYQTAIQSIAFYNSSDQPSLLTRTVQWTVNDGDTDSVSVTRDIVMNAVNDTPSVSGPGSAYTITEQTNLNIHGTGFSVTDVDAASGTMTATFSLGEGTIALVAGDSGVNITANNASTVSFTGTLTQIDALLTGGSTGTIVYNNASDTPSASTTVTLTVNDGGNTGADPGLTADGTSEEDSASQTINISATNDDPTNVGSLPGDIGIAEDVLTPINLSAVDFSDVDAGSSDLTVTLSTSTGGELTLAADASIDFGGTATARTLTGTLAELNTYFNNTSNIQYLHGTPHTFGDNADTITVVINDNGNTGTGGGTDQNLGTVNVDITAVNDEQVLATNAGTTVAEGSTGTVITTAMLHTTDVDNTDNQLVYTVNAVTSNGILRLSGTTLGLNDTFTQADIDAGNITYDHDGSQTSTDTFDFTVDDGAGTTTSSTFNFTVTNVNDAPVNTVPGAQAVNEDTSLAISGISVADVDDNLSTVQLTVINGTLNVTLSGSASISAGANGTNTLTLSGSRTDINTTLGSLTYQGNLNFNGNDTLTVLSTDTDSATDSDTVAITVGAVNDTPTVTGPGSAYAATEQTNLNIHGTGFNINDVDAAAGIMTATFTVGEGAITIAEGNSGVSIAGGNGTATVTVTGTLNQIDALLTGTSTGTIVYNNGSDAPSASTTITLTINDGGNTGTDPGLTADGTSEQDTVSQTINITAVNDEQVLATNAGTTVAEGSTGTVITTAMLHTTDVDNTDNQLVYTVNAVTSNGILRLSGTTLGLNDTFTQADIDAGNITYDHDGSQTSTDTFDFTVDDGAGTTTSATFNFTVTNVNDAPVNTVPGAQAVNEDTSLAISGISVADADDNLSTVQMTVDNGVLNVTLSGAASISAGANGSSDLTLSGSLADINATLASLTYQGNLNFNGSDTLTVLSTDSNAATDSDTVTITVNAVNDTPIVNGPGSAYTITEQTNLNIHGTGFSVTDVDAASGTMTATFSAGEGTIALAVGDSGVNITANNASTVSFTATLAQIDALLTGTSTGTIVYNNASDTPSASTTITLTVNDGGNTGADPGLTADGTSEEDSASQTINITATNDDPFDNGSLPSDVTVTEDVLTAVDLSSVDFSDVDAGASDLTVTLSTSTGGQITLEADASIDFGGTATAPTLTGTLAELNAYFDNASNIQYLHGTPNTFGNDVDTITVVINDNGNTGTGGGTDQNLGTVNVDITAVNDEEVLATNTGTTVAEGSTGNVVTTAMLETTDVDNTSAQLVYTVDAAPTNGTLRLSGTALGLSDTFTQADIDAGNVTYDHDGSQTSADSFDFTVDDGAGTTTASTFNFTVTNVNDAPVNTVPGAQTVDEDASINIAGISVADADDNLSTVRLTVNDGILDVTLSGTAFIFAGANGSSDLTLSGSLADINATLASLTYQSNLNFNGSDTLTVLSTDSDSASDSDTVVITVGAVNDDPTNAGSLPTDVTVTEDVATNVDLSAIDLSDVDAGSSSIRVTLTTSTGGNLSGAAAGITVSGNLTNTLTLEGSLADLNVYLDNSNSIFYLHQTTNTFGDNADAISVVVNDNGNTGSGGGTDQNLGTVNVDITAVNDEEALTTNAGTTVAEGSTGYTITTAMLQTTDVDNTDAQLVYTVDAVTSNGILRLSGTALGLNDTFTQADINAGLVTYDHDGSQTSSDTFDFTVDDGAGSTTSATFNFTVTNVNDAPVNTVPGAQTVDEDTSVNITGISVADADDNLSTLQLTVSDGTLNVTLSGTASISAGANGSSNLTLSGSLADINATLASLTYQGNLHFNGTDTLTVLSTDVDSASDSDTVAITVNAVNDTPIVNGPGSAYTVNEQTNLSIEETGFTVTDVDAASGTMTATFAVGEGTIALAAGDSGVNITANNASTVSFTGTLAQIDALLTGTSTGTIVYNNTNDTPSASATITLTVNDGGNTGTDPGLTADGTSEADAASQTINITAINDEEVLATNTGVTVTEGSTSNAVTTAMLETTDVDNTAAQLVYTVDVAPTNGTLRLSGTALGLSDTFTQADIDAGNVTYDHDGSQTSADSFDFTVDDGTGITTSATFNVTVTNVNDAPVNTVPGSQTVDEDTSINIAGISISDDDNNLSTVRLTVNSGTLDVTLTGTAFIFAGANGSSDLTLGGPLADINATLASLTYQGSLNFNGNDTLTVLSTDSNGATDSDTVAITVVAVNDTPSVTGPGAAYLATEQTDLDIHGTGFSVTDLDATSGIMTATITVGEGAIVLAAGDSGTIITANNASTVSFTGTLAQINALLAGSSTGTIVYNNASDTPSAATTIALTVNDGGNTGSDPGLTADGTSEEGSATQTINISAIDDAPTISNVIDQVIDEDTSTGPLAFAVADPENATLTVTASSSDTSLIPNSSIFLTDLGGGNWTVEVVPVANASGGPVSIELAVDDGNAVTTTQFAVTVTPVNDAPVVTGGPFAVFENASNGTFVGSMSVTDVDTNDSQTLTITGGSGAAIFAINNLGQITVSDTSLLDFESSSNHTIEVTATDSSNLSASALVTIQVIDQNEIPVAVNDNYTVNEGDILTVNSAGVRTNDTDPEGDTLSVSLVSGPNHGTLTLNPDGSFVYAHDGSETTSDQFQYAVTDSMGNTATASVVLNIVPVNDAPDGATDTFTAPAGELRISATDGVLANDFDIEGGQISSVLVGGPTNGSLSMLSDGSFVYAPDPGFVGTDSFTYAVSDGQTTSSPITVLIEVLGGADPGNNQPNDGTPNTTQPDSSEDERDPVQDASETPSTIQNIPTIDVRSGPEGEPKATQQSEEGTNAPSFAGPESLLEPEEGVYQHTSPRFFAMAKRMDMNIQRLASEPLRPFLTMGVTKHLLTVLPIENGEGQDGSAEFQRIAVGTTTAISSALTVGYVVWLIRGGTILASVLSTMPSWIAYDPLPILESFHEEEREDEVSLASLVEAD